MIRLLRCWSAYEGLLCDAKNCSAQRLVLLSTFHETKLEAVIYEASSGVKDFLNTPRG